MKLMKKILFTFGIIFSGNMYTVRIKLSEGDKEVLKELYSTSKSYSNLSSEVRSLVDKFLWNTIKLENGNTYRLFLCSKGKGREHEQSLKCHVFCQGKNSLRTISDLIQTDKDFAFLVKSQNSNYIQNKDSMKLLSAVQENKAFYKKLTDGLETYKAEKNYIDYLENQKQVSSKYIDTWKNYALLGSSVVEKNSAKLVSNANVPSQVAAKVTTSNFVKAIPTSNIPFVMSVLKVKKIIPAIAVAGATGLAYNYFKKNDEVDNKKEISFGSKNNVPEKNFSYVEQLSSFCTSNPGKVSGAAVVIGALVYGAYKLYESDFFAESKSKKIESK